MNRPKIQEVQRTDQAPQRRKRSRGQALVEFAVVLPVFLLILSGVLDFGFLLYSPDDRDQRDQGSCPVRQHRSVHGRGAGNSTTWTRMKGQATNIGTADGLKVAAGVLVHAALGDLADHVDYVLPGGWHVDVGSLTGDAVMATATYQYQTFFPLLFGAKINVTVSNQMVIFPPPPPN